MAVMTLAETPLPEDTRQAVLDRWTRDGFSLVGVVQIVPTVPGEEPLSILDRVPEAYRGQHIVAIAAPDSEVLARRQQPGPDMFALLVAGEVELTQGAPAGLAHEPCC